MRPSPVLLLALLLGAFALVGLPSLVHAVCASNMGRVYVPVGCSTIQEAINVANPGDTLIVSVGIYHERFLVNKTVHIVGRPSSSTILDGDGAGPVATVTANGVSITGFTVTDSGVNSQAVRVLTANFVSVNESIVESDTTSAQSTGVGVSLFMSNDSLVDGDVFANNLVAVNITRSTRDIVSNDVVSTNDQFGVEVLDSSSSLVSQNLFGLGVDAVRLVGPLTKLNNVTGNVVRNSSGAAVLLLDRPTGNTMADNVFLMNHIGVNVENATGNTYYHNSFYCPSPVRPSCLRHVSQRFPGDGSSDVWDNRSIGGAKWGGNYWDNYTGTDPDGDGIGDTPFHFSSAIGQDSYPLMSPFSQVPLAVAGIVASRISGVAPLTVSFRTVAVGSLTPYSYSWNFGDTSAVQNATSLSHTFSRPGNYSVKVLVRDSSGTGDVGTIGITVYAGAPPPSLSTILEIVGAVVGVAAIVGVVLLRARRSRAAAAKVGPAAHSKPDKNRKKLRAERGQPG